MQITKPVLPVRLSFRPRQVVVVTCLALLVFAYASYLRLWWPQLGVDWRGTYYPAVRLMLAGQNPYAVATLHNPFWTLFPLLPFALMGEWIGSACYLLFSIFSYGFVAYRLRARLVAWTAFMTSLPVLYAMGMQNVDALVLWGYILPPPLGLFLVLIKPQMGIGICLYWAHVAWRQGRWRRLLGTFAPVAAAFGLSFLLFGNWLAETSENILASRWNASLWPWSIPLGIALMYIAIRYGNDKAAVSSSPMLSPYLAAHSWATAFVGLLENDVLMVLASAAVWLFYWVALLLIGR